MFAAARELGFRPNLLGRQLRLQTTQLIGVVVPNLLNPVFAEQLQAMERAARLRGYSLLLATTDYSSERESIVVEELLRQRVDGLVLTVTDAESNSVLNSLASEQTPFVLAYHQPSNPSYSAVSVDNRAGMAWPRVICSKRGTDASAWSPAPRCSPTARACATPAIATRCASTGLKAAQ